MADQFESKNANEEDMRKAFSERLKELIQEAGGDKEFIEKLDKLQPKVSTDIKLLNRWKNTGNGISVEKIYLIAVAYNVSVDWLLGLSLEKLRGRLSFKLPTTYGDVLSILNNLFEKEIFGIANSSHWIIDEDPKTESGILLPQYIQIYTTKKDTHLLDRIKELNSTGELSGKEITDAWERVIKLEINNPIPEKQVFRRTNSNKTDTSATVLDDKSLIKQVDAQLDKLKNGRSDKDFGKTIRVAQSTVQGWSHDHLPKTYNLYKIAKIYNVPADWILGLDGAGCTVIPWGNEVHTYGGVLSILKHLLDKGTIGFIAHPDLDPDDACWDNKNGLVIDDLFIIADPFLYGLLLKQQLLEHFSNTVFKEMFEEQIDKYKDYPLLSFKEDIRPDVRKILCNLQDGETNQYIDFDKLYEDLQKLSNSKSDK